MSAPSLLGTVVLFCIDEKGPIYRPLLVTDVHAEERMTGELFLSWIDDRSSAWCRATMFYAPSAQSRSLEVVMARHGSGIGRWITQAEFQSLTESYVPEPARSESASPSARAPQVPEEGKEPAVDRPAQNAR